MSTGALSYAQIEKLWTDNGGSKAMAPVMAAIAIAESGGNPTSLNNNPNTGDYSVGLWQINYYGNLLSSRTAAYGTPQALQGNANAQAKAAISLSNNGTNLAPWRSDPVAGAVLAGKPIPSQYTNGQTIGAALAALPGSGATACTPVIEFPGVAGIGKVTLLDSCQAQEVLGAVLMMAGGFLFVTGLLVILADVGLRKSAPAIIGAVAGNRAGKRSSERRMAEREHASGLRTQEAESKASARRYGSGSERSLPGAADRERWGREGFPGD